MQGDLQAGGDGHHPVGPGQVRTPGGPGHVVRDQAQADPQHPQGFNLVQAGGDVGERVRGASFQGDQD